MNQKNGRKGAMVIKLELEKAYDCMEWHFIKETMQDDELPCKLIQIIMDCITSGACRLL